MAIQDFLANRSNSIETKFYKHDIILKSKYRRYSFI